MWELPSPKASELLLVFQQTPIHEKKSQNTNHISPILDKIRGWAEAGSPAEGLWLWLMSCGARCWVRFPCHSTTPGATQRTGSAPTLWPPPVITWCICVNQGDLSRLMHSSMKPGGWRPGSLPPLSSDMAEGASTAKTVDFLSRTYPSTTTLQSHQLSRHVSEIATRSNSLFSLTCLMAS